MSVHFITVINGVITGQHFGDIDADFFDTPYYGHERVVIPNGVHVRELDKVEFYYNDWERKSNMQLIDEGLLPMPEGYIREANEFRRMTQEERIKAGLEELSSGMKIEGDKIIPMTIQEQVAAGQITQADYESRLAAGNTAELQHRLAELQTPEALAQAEIDEVYAAERKEKLTALLAVKKQDGWPLVVVWPE